jgi:putative redox protein
MENIVTANSKTGNIPYHTSLKAGNHQFVADEPEAAGGKDAGPTPSQLLCSALASCIGITLRMYAGRKTWDTGEISVTVQLDRSGDTPNFDIDITYENELNEEQLKRMSIIAGKCPVHKLLHNDVTFSYS